MVITSINAVVLVELVFAARRRVWLLFPKVTKSNAKALLTAEPSKEHCALRGGMRHLRMPFRLFRFVCGTQTLKMRCDRQPFRNPDCFNSAAHRLVVIKSVRLRFRLTAKTTLTPLLLLSPKSLTTFRGPLGRKSILPSISKSADFSMGTGDAKVGVTVSSS